MKALFTALAAQRKDAGVMVAGLVAAGVVGGGLYRPRLRT
jgi:hypothetical protein